MAARKRQVNRDPQADALKSVPNGTGALIIEMEEAQRQRRTKRNAQLQTSKLKQREEKVKERREIHRSVKKQRRKLSKGKRVIVFVILVFALAVLGVSGYKIINLKIAETKVVETYEGKLTEKKKLLREYSMVNDPKYIEKQARERFHMIIEGEMIYVYPEEQGDNSQ